MAQVTAVVSPQELRARLDRLPHVRLAHLPTPLDEAPNLARRLGGPRIFVKREDLTGLAFGGNKARILEYTMADAVRQGADTIVACAFAQSNHCRQAAAAAARLGLRAVLVLGRGEKAEQVQGNLLLDDLLGAEIVRTDEETLESISARAAAVTESLQAAGRRAVQVSLTPGATALAAAAFVGCVLELHEQLTQAAVSPTRIYVASSGGTQAGLVLGSLALGAPWTVAGYTPIARPERRDRVAGIVNDAARLLDLPVHAGPDDIANFDSELGPGYGRLSPDAIGALRLLAATEGILLDPVYTAKAMSGLVRDVRAGTYRADESIVFVHTGGTPALFSYADELAGR
jgi:D-cysteine desulfhydrase family pyridoxal phosphate-dependent enzyme